MNLFDVADGTGTDNFHGFAKSVFGRPLVAHLSDDASFFGDLLHGASFPNRPCQRLLAVDMLAHTHRFNGRCRMVMVRRADGHDVNFVTQAVQHFTIVRELFGILELTALLFQCSPVNVAES